MNKELAQISSMKLDIKERGILTFWIQIDYEDGLSQGIGGYALDEYDSIKKDRIGSKYGTEMIIALLTILNINDFSEASKKHIWVLYDDEGFNRKVKGIESLKEDGSNSLIFEDVLKDKWRINI